MPMRSQPLDDRFTRKLGLNDEKPDYSERNIKSQRMGKILDFLDREDRKISFKTRLGWKWQRVKDFFYDTRHTIRNHMRWHKTLKRLRPWAGYDGLITVMQAQLRQYIKYEEKHGHSEKAYKMNKIATVKETIELLERMKEPQEYSTRRRDAVEAKYPDYQTLVTEYINGGGGYSGDFVAQGNGWAGKEAGSDPREGYFEFVDGRLQLATSPDREETDRLVAEVHKYHEELHNAYAQAEIDAQEDFDKLAQLFKDNFYTWWD